MPLRCGATRLSASASDSASASWPACWSMILMRFAHSLIESWMSLSFRFIGALSSVVVGRPKRGPGVECCSFLLRADDSRHKISLAAINSRCQARLNIFLSGRKGLRIRDEKKPPAAVLYGGFSSLMARRASSAFPLVFCFRIVDGLPLHVRRRVVTSAGEWGYVVNNPARATPARSAGGWARMAMLEG